ncbi:MAG TPA: SIR2 family protein [Gemmataceae bacterium]|nr:SIR2 family protein [Gemmataceae bacterium]
MATATQQLEQALIAHPDRVIIVTGIGVSLASGANHACATWKGLLQHGLQQCQDMCGTDHTLIEAQRAILASANAPAHALAGVGQFITDELTQKRPGLYGAWLSESIGSVIPKDASLVRALASLGGKLTTTNYDNTIEAGTGRSAITWRQRALATRFFREPTEDVLHLHGHFRHPDSIVLGARSYGEICGDDFSRTALRGFMISGTFLFVGCGAGLDDPNFGVLLDWARTTLKECHHSHFILVRSDELDAWRTHLHGIPVEPIPYGSSHTDLLQFLEQLSARVKQQRAPGQLSLLASSQSDFDAKWDELGLNRESVPVQEYFQRSRMLAGDLWRAGGRRRAAMAFSSRLMFQSEGLLISDHLEFSMDAAEWLLEDGLPSMASDHLGGIGKTLPGVDISQEQLRRYRDLSIRCMDALCAYTETMQAIEDSLSHADSEEREWLQAIRSEIHFLQGDYAEATDEGGESNDQ